MSIRLLYLSIIILLVKIDTTAATDGSSTNAYSSGMGGVSVALNNANTIIDNQAAAAHIESIYIGTNYSVDFTGIAESFVFVSLPSSLGTFTASYNYYGDDRYSESSAGVAYSRNFGDMFAASLQFDYYALSLIQNGKDSYAFGGEIGLIAKPTESFTLGFHLFNFTQASYSTLYYDQDLPVSLKLGVSYAFVDDFIIACEGESSSLYGTSFRGGFDYQIAKVVALRAGGGSNPAHASIGMGVTVKKIYLDIAGESIRNFGERTSVSLSYSF